MSDHFWLDLVVLVLSTFVFSFVRSFTNKKEEEKKNTSSSRATLWEINRKLRIKFLISTREVARPLEVNILKRQSEKYEQFPHNFVEIKILK